MNKLFWRFWFASTILTGILAGFMISHILQLGHFFTWSAETGVSLSNFTAFRPGNRPYDFIYDCYLLAQLAIGIIWTVLAFLSKREKRENYSNNSRVSNCLGCYHLYILWYGWGRISVLIRNCRCKYDAKFALLNLPVHTSFALIYSVSFFLLLFIAYKNLEFKNLES